LVETSPTCLRAGDAAATALPGGSQHTTDRSTSDTPAASGSPAFSSVDACGRSVRARPADRHGSRVLELGAARRDYRLALPRGGGVGWRVLGSLTSRRCSPARARGALLGTNRRSAAGLSTSSATAPPSGRAFADGHFDVVIAANVLHANRRSAHCAGAVRRCSRRGGVLLLVRGRRAQRIGPTPLAGLTAAGGGRRQCAAVPEPPCCIDTQR